MNLSQFFEHWSIRENPFRGEEARTDAVFSRLGTPAITGLSSTPRQAEQASAPVKPSAMHSDFEKILGDLNRPSTSIVFGEKGSGKTAIRMQIEGCIRAHNIRHPDRKVFLIPFDDLNAFLDRIHERAGGKTPADSFKTLRLVDLIDAMLSIGVTKFVHQLLGKHEDSEELGQRPKKTLKKLTKGQRSELLALQAVYDRDRRAADRTAKLRRAMNRPEPIGRTLQGVGVLGGWVIPLLFAVWATFSLPEDSPLNGPWIMPTFFVLLGLYLALVLKHLLWDRIAMSAFVSRLRRHAPTLIRADESYAQSFRQLGSDSRAPDLMPVSDTEDLRFDLGRRFRQILNVFGYTSLIVVIDRVDEPTLVNGDAEIMRAIVWPLFNNKFLQQDGFGMKMLLPIELRHALNKESSQFFQEARLDKQNMVERLTWTGAMLYDLADSRLQACADPREAPEGAEPKPLRLLDLFADDVTRQDIVDALDQMHQPRDAFKFLYQCLTEHCSNVTADQEQWRVPRLVLETVRKGQAERVQQLYRGITPA